MTLKNKYEEGSTGFLYYAHNNGDIDYLRLAICSAITGKYQLSDFRAMVVTDTGSLFGLNKRNRELLNELFEEIKINDDFNDDNKRLIISGDKFGELSLWHNGTRINAYEDSIYDETILIDVDFLFQDSNLNKLWGSITPIKMNKDIIPAVNKAEATRVHFQSSEMVSAFTIHMYWATLVYFNRSSISKEFFDLVNHIKDNYFYYQRLYQITDRSYRNDYSFSIALHMVNGFVTPGKEWEIPYKFILSRNCDEIYRIDKEQTKIVLKTLDGFQGFNAQNISLHCMNKKSLIDQYERLLKVYDYE